MNLVKNADRYFSKQAKLAILGYVLLSITFFLPLNKTSDNKEKMPYNFTERLLSFLLMLLPIVISVYTINCMVLGINKGGLPCTLLAWANSLSVFLWCLLFFILTLLLINKGGVPEGFSNCTKKDE